MTEEKFDRLQETAAKFAHTSLEYADYEDYTAHEILSDTDKLILLHGTDAETKLKNYQWACNDVNTLLDAMQPESDTLVQFVPAEWIPAFKARGFVDYARWQDYFIRDLSAVEVLSGGELLDDAHCADAAAVTQACRYQSRGFTGQTEQWIRAWRNNDEDDTENNAIFVEKDGERIVGLVCTGTYAHDSEKGAIVWIREAAVDPAYQGRGIGRRLIRQALGYGKRLGAKRAFLAADECNIAAIGLYKSLGFTEGQDAPQNDLIFAGNR